MRRLPIHVRLTALYLVSLSVIMTTFAFASWYAMKISMYHAIDNDLGYRMAAIVPFLRTHSLSTPDSFAKTFANSSDSAVVGVFVQVDDAQSGMLYQSDVLAAHGVPILPPGTADGTITRRTVHHAGWTIRVATRVIAVHNVLLTVHVVEPLSDLLTALQGVTFSFAYLVLIALLITASVGYWISRRALAPVEQIRRQADAIDPKDLTARLQVPVQDDELGRLARTLNSMLTRIENGFRSVERFTADASHELRAPLAFIITAGDVSLRRERSREELVDSMRKMLVESRRMSRLVEDLLALARGDALSTNTQQEPIDLGALIQEAVDQMSPTAAAKGLSVGLTLPRHPVHVSGAPSDLRRLLLILIDNAIKYTDAGGLRITLQEEPAHVQFTVSDTGIGLEESTLPHLFERFWRADKARSRAQGGVGLGLALAAQIVQRHGGTILAESTGGKGATFVVKLPGIRHHMLAEGS